MDINKALPKEEQTTTWSSKLGFLAAIIGSAVGLGCFWRFPYLVGENGGGAFIIIYLITTLLIGLPALIAEIMLGRMGKRSPIGSIAAIIQAEKKSVFWKSIGYCAVLSSVILLSYYSVVGGWTLKYFASSFMGYFRGIHPEASKAFFQHFTQNPLDVLLWYSLFMGMISLIILAGVQKGIERSVAFMTPMLFSVLMGLIIYACTLKGFGEALRFSVKIDFSKVHWGPTLLAAIGHSFFSLSVGQGAMMMYGAYSTQDSDIPGSSFKVFLATAFVAVGASIVIFSFIFTFGLKTAQGPGLTFMTLPIAFGQMGFVGLIVGTLFFMLLSLAAVGPSISLLQPGTVWLQEHFKIKRTQAVLLGVSIVFSLGLLSAFSTNLLAHVHPFAPLGFFKDKTFADAFDYICANILMLIGAFLMTIFVGWALSGKAVSRALNVSEEAQPLWFVFWRFFVRYFAPAGILIVFFSAFLG